MTLSQRLLGTAIVSVAFVAGADAFAADHPAPVRKLTPRAAVERATAERYQANPWVSRDVLPLVAPLDTRRVAAWAEPSIPAPTASASKRQRSGGRKALGAIVGAAGGFFVGGYLGAVIEGDCNCDDPGLRGAIIGAPIGAVTGGILGYKFLF
jgi:hypothetical protein